MRKRFLLIFFILNFVYIAYPLLLSTSEVENISKIELINGSNIYERVFMFFFPISNVYDTYFDMDYNSINLNIEIKKKDILKEPSTPSYFESDIVVKIKEINYNYSNENLFNITLQCNQKFIKKKALLKIYRNGNLLIIRGNINNLKIKEITENEYFQNRLNWNLPLYFDFRFKIN